METIKNYLDAMFLKLPDTYETKRAKKDLYAMMEDKYEELLKEGMAENEAVGTVISEFGNLDEIASDLGLEKAADGTYHEPLEEESFGRGPRQDEIFSRGKNDKEDDEMYYENKYMNGVMNVYWQTITCVYLIWSFLTFDWYITWIIWPVAAVVHKIIENIWGEKR